MRDKKSINEMLDMILDYYKANAPDKWKVDNRNEMFKKLEFVAFKIRVTEQPEMFRFLIQKLKDDEMIKGEGDDYQITFKGLVSDGYVRQEAEELQIKKNAKVLSDLQLKSAAMQVSLIRLQWIIAGLSAIAAWYYCVEIWKYYHPIHICH